MTSEERQRVAAEQQRNLFAAREADAQRKRQERELAKRQEEEREARDNARLRRQQMDMANRAPAASSRYDYDALRRENERQAAEIKRRKEEELKKKLEADRRDEMRLKREREQLAAKQEEDKKQEAFKKLQAENAALAAEKKRLAEEKARKEKEEEEKDRIRLERQRQELAERNKQQTPKPAVATPPKAETPKRAPVGSKSRRDLFGGDKPKKPVLKHDPWADSLEQEFNKVNQSRPPPEDAIQVLTRQMEKEKGLRIAAEDELIKLRSTSYLEGASEFMAASTSSASPVNKLTVKPGSLAHHGMRLLSAAFSPVADELIEDTETEALTALQRAQQRLKRLELLGDRHPSGDQLDLLLNEEEEQSRPHLESHADFIPIDEDIGAISRPRRSRVGAVDLT